MGVAARHRLEITKGKPRTSQDVGSICREGGNGQGRSPVETIGMNRGGSRTRWLEGVAISMVIAALVAGCTTAGASPIPGGSGGSIVPSPSGAASPSPEASASVGVSPAIAPSETPVARATVGASTSPVISGRWTGIKWTNLGRVAQLAPPPTASSMTDVSVFGWSRGYVGFQMIVTDDTSAIWKYTLVSSSSPDAVRWTADRPMAHPALNYAVEITGLEEGPSGLLAVGRMPPEACGGPPTVSAMWTSTDELTWTLVTPPADFASASVYTVDGGSSGFIATGVLKDGVTQAVWLSADGRSWHQGALPNSTFGDVLVQGGTAFGGGFVVSGAVRGDEGCGGYQLLTPSLWWSTDGKGWTRATLDGAAPATDASIAVTKISDHALMAVASGWNAVTQVSSEKVWVTSDGRTWKLIVSPSKMLDSPIRTDGRQGLALVDPDVNPPTTDGPVVVSAVDDDLTVRPLPQTGDVPMASQSASSRITSMGPAGLVMMSSDYSILWLGAPAAR